MGCAIDECMAVDKHGAAPERVEQALSALDHLADQLRRIEHLRETVAALVVENATLRRDNARLAQDLSATVADRAYMQTTLLGAEEQAKLHRQQVLDLLEAQTESESRVLELEELNSSLMSMYVSSFQLHATLDLVEIVRVVEEILVNFIGASSYAILLTDDDGSFRIHAESGLDGRLAASGIRPHGVLAEVLGRQSPYVHTSSGPAREGILAAVPLVTGRRTVGALLVYSLLAQKDRFLGNDVDLFSLLGGHAASAVVSARLYARTDRKVRTLQAMLQLLEEPDADA
jgi:hypothetical protein